MKLQRLTLGFREERTRMSCIDLIVRAIKSARTMGLDGAQASSGVGDPTMGLFTKNRDRTQPALPQGASH